MCSHTQMHTHRVNMHQEKEFCPCPSSCSGPSFGDIPAERLRWYDWGVRLGHSQASHHQSLELFLVANQNSAPLISILIFCPWQPRLHFLSQDSGALGTTCKCCPDIIPLLWWLLSVSINVPGLPRVVMCIRIFFPFKTFPLYIGTVFPVPIQPPRTLGSFLPLAPVSDVSCRQKGTLDVFERSLG